MADGAVAYVACDTNMQLITMQKKDDAAQSTMPSSYDRMAVPRRMLANEKPDEFRNRVRGLYANRIAIYAAPGHVFVDSSTR